MATDRRNFIRTATAGLTSGLVAAPALAAAQADGAQKPLLPPPDVSRYIVDPGPKETLHGLKAACSTGNPIVTETIINTMRAGGNAVDAAIAGAMVQATIESHLSNHTGTITFLHYDARRGQFHQLDGTGTFPSGLAPFKPRPREGGGSAFMTACIPNFMPALREMHGRFATKPWAALCQEAIRWAEEGHPVSSFEYGVYATEIEERTYFPEGRKFHMPSGYLVPAGKRFGSRDMAETLKRVAAEGPDYMITGGWADLFISTANQMGWKITKAHMTETPPRWIEPLRFAHNEFEIVGLAPPQQQGLFLSIVLGILRNLKIRELGADSPEHLFYMAHALRWGLYHCAYTGDPKAADYAYDQLMDDGLHAAIARIIRGMRPRIDLTEHTRLTSQPRGSAGLPTGGSAIQGQHPGTCELSIVDRDGSWVQMTHTLQTGGIPGMVIGGIPMAGSSATFTGMSGNMDVKIHPGIRMRRNLGNTMVLKNGKIVYSLGSPGNVYFTVPQILTRLLDFRTDAYQAIDAPRMLPIGEDGSITVEDRLPEATLQGLRSFGVNVRVVPVYDWHMGSFQMCFRDPRTGELCATADPRRCGIAGGIR